MATLCANGFHVGDGGDGSPATGANRISADARRFARGELFSPYGLQLRDTAAYLPMLYSESARSPVAIREIWERVFIRVRRFQTSGTPDTVVWSLKGDLEGTPALFVRVGSGGALSLYNQGNQTQPGELLSSTSISLNTWYCLELHARFNNATQVLPDPPYENDGLVEWAVNGSSQSFNRAGVNPQYGVDRRGQKAVTSHLGDAANTTKGLDIDYADWIIDDAGWIGDTRRTTALRVTGPGTYTQWAGNNPDWRHQIDWPQPGVDLAEGVSTTATMVKQSYTVETPASRGITTALRSGRVCAYFNVVGGGAHKLLVRRTTGLGSTETLYNIGTPANGSWQTWRVDTSGWDPSDTIEVGVETSTTMGLTTRLAACLFIVEHETPEPDTPGTLVRVVQKTYTGNATELTIDLSEPGLTDQLPAMVLTLPESVIVAPGAWWWTSRVVPTARDNALAQTLTIRAAPGKVHITGSADSANRNATSYRLIAVFDPSEYLIERGAVALNPTTDNRTIPLHDSAFTPECIFIAREAPSSYDTSKNFYWGAGFTGDSTAKLSTNAALVADAIQAVSAGSFEVGTLLNETGYDCAYVAWRRDTVHPLPPLPAPIVDISSYTGNGTNPRTITLSLNKETPIFAMIAPADAGNRWIRHGTIARQWMGGNSGSGNAITSFGVDSLTVGSELNTNNVIYTVFALRAGDGGGGYAYASARITPSDVIGARTRIVTRAPLLPGEGVSSDQAHSAAYVSVNVTTGGAVPYWAQTGYIRKRFGSTTVNSDAYFEVRSGPGPSAPNYYFNYLEQYPVAGTSHDYQLDLDTSTGTWTASYDGSPIDTKTHAIWETNVGNYISFSGEVFDVRTDMPGTSSDKCTFTNCEYRTVGGAYGSAGLVSGHVNSTDFREWMAVHLSGTSFEIWDLTPI